jgi:hypothetical protein
MMRLCARWRKDLISAHTRVANRLHAVILELVPGGYAGEIYASKGERLLEAFEPAGASLLPARNWPRSSWATSAAWTGSQLSSRSASLPWWPRRPRSSASGR